MFELAKLKQEARKLLDQVNPDTGHTSFLKAEYQEPSSFGEVFDKADLKCKIKILRQQFYAL